MATENRLASEQSPYLLQHKNNPVDWYPWSEDAFERARSEDRPVFLSIGYATCHWCHVMEHESFEDPDVARLMNESFVSIKVDREERPDIDSIYMAVCQMLTGQGGWPLTIVMTPERRPFFAATYIPKRSRHGRAGMVELIPRITSVWRDQREEVLRSADHLTETLRRASTFASDAEAPALQQTLQKGFEELRNRYDGAHGGFGSAPKFPTPHNLLFLLRFAVRTESTEALTMVVDTLLSMRRGGIFDQIGGGFHRYSTDAAWLLPHFEKMLYDQALLTAAYAEAYQATGNPELRDTAEAVIGYVLRDLSAPDGGFFCAEDADSEGREGKFYLWTVEEVEEVLDTEDAALVTRAFGLLEEGNFEEEATGAQIGENVLGLQYAWVELARESGAGPDDVRVRLNRAAKTLFERREKRVRPGLDDKVLTDWNGLMIAALALAARALESPALLERAREAAHFILGTMRDTDGNLLHRYRAGEAGIQGMADDYAAVTWGLIELYEASFDAAYLEAAADVAERMHRLLWDTDAGGYYLAPEHATDLIVRQKELYDGALPSANSLQAWNLIRLARLTGNSELEGRAEAIFEYAAPFVAQHPAAYTALLVAMEMSVSPSLEVVVAGDPRSERTMSLLEVVRDGYRPNLVILQRPDDERVLEVLRRVAPYTEHQVSVNGQPAAYVCRNFACETPTTEPEALRSLLDDNQG